MGKKKNTDEATGLEDGSVLSRPAQLTATEIQSQEFRLAFRGYNEKDVDAFLDRVTEEYSRLFEENQRLRGGAPLDGGASVSDAARAAEEIKRKAREEAAAILANAQTQTGGVVPVAGAVGSTGAMGKFITGEREFLQSLASLIQQHAESVKSTARDAQHSQAAAAKAAAAALPTVPVSAPELSEQSAIEDTSPELSAARSEDAAGDSSVTHAAEEATESAWTATASPAAPPATNESPYAEQAVNSSEFSSGTAGRDEVISIPPSAVDTPMADLSAESASTQEAGQSDFGTRVSVDLEQREFDDEGEVASVRLPDSPLSESDEPATETPGEERSLRDLFWGDDK